MTIALGFCTNDGVVLCTDTQETISGYIKTYDGKVVTCVFENLVMAIAGSGTSDYIKTARDAVAENFPDCKTFLEVRTAIEERLMEFFDKRLARWAYFEERDRPTVELLVSFCGRNAGKNIPHALFHYSGPAFHRVSQKAIGGGILLANHLIQRYSHGNFNVDQIASIAAFILSKVKEGVDGCGGQTNIVALRKGGDFAFGEYTDLQQIDEVFHKLENDIDKEIVKAILKRKIQLSWLSKLVAKRQKEKADKTI
jgi:20S proteasome alpha/beta subunit